MLKSHPFTGVGFDQYTEYNHAVAHNSFVHTFAELGFTGAFIFVGMFYWYFKGLALIPDTNAEFAPWRRALLTSAVGMCTCAWFLSRQYVAIFYVLLALGAAAINLHVPPEKREKLQTSPTDIVIDRRVDDLRHGVRLLFHQNDGGVGRRITKGWGAVRVPLALL